MKTAETKYTRGAATLGDDNTLVGYAARFNEESQILFDKTVCAKPFIEIIKPGAFSRNLRENKDIRSLYNHDRGAVLGRTSAGTLSLLEDSQGLHFVNPLPDITVARDLKVSMGRGDIDGCSFFGYVVDDHVDLRGPSEPALRTIFDIELVEVTPATAFPAYTTTTVALRSQYPEFFEAPPETKVYPVSLARARLQLSGMLD